MSSVQSRRSWTVYEELSYFPPRQVKKSSVSMRSQKLPSDLKQLFLKEWLKRFLFTHQILLAYTSVNFPMTVFVFNGRTNYGYWAQAQSTAMQYRQSNRRVDYILLIYDQNQATLSVHFCLRAYLSCWKWSRKKQRTSCLSTIDHTFHSFDK